MTALPPAKKPRSMVVPLTIVTLLINAALWIGLVWFLTRPQDWSPLSQELLPGPRADQADGNQAINQWQQAKGKYPIEKDGFIKSGKYVTFNGASHLGRGDASNPKSLNDYLAHIGYRSLIIKLTPEEKTRRGEYIATFSDDNWSDITIHYPTKNPNP